MAGQEVRVQRAAPSSHANFRPPYIPPFRQQRLDATGGEQTEYEIQQRAWTRMKKSINGVVNRVNASNIPTCSIELFRQNIIRGRGVFCKSLLRAQSASPTFSPVFASLVAVINTRAPEIAALLIARLVAQLRTAFDMPGKSLCLASSKFLACLFNQQVTNDVVLLEFFAKCLQEPSDKTIEYAVSTLQVSAPFLADKAPRALEVVFQRLREVLHEGEIGRKAQVMVEDLMNMRRKRFAGRDQIPPGLDLVEDDDIITHFASLEEEEDVDLQEEWNSFTYDKDYENNEKAYEKIKRQILGAQFRPPVQKVLDLVKPLPSKGGDRAALDRAEKEDAKKAEKPLDMTNTELVDFRRTVYLTIGSGLSFEEWAHKLVRLMRSNRGREVELCKMIIESCSQEKTFLRSYGLLGQRFCLMDRVYIEAFEEIFATQYATLHRLDTRKIRNTACFYASLLASEALPWNVLQVVRLVEEETTSSSRIYLKILFQEISRALGATKLQKCLQNPGITGHLAGIFPTDSAQNARFSINFFTSIGLGYVTEELREKLKTLPKEIVAPVEDSDSSSSLSSSSLSSSSLSPSSGDEKLENTGKNSARGSGKRSNEVTSPDHLDLPAKAPRRSFDLTGYGQRSEERSRSYISDEKRRTVPLKKGNGSSEHREWPLRPRVVASTPGRSASADRLKEHRRNPASGELRSGKSSVREDGSRSTMRKRRRDYSPDEYYEDERRRDSGRMTRPRHHYESDSSESSYERSRRSKQSRRSYDGRRRSGGDNSVRNRHSSRRHSDSMQRRRARSPLPSRRRSYSYSSSFDSLASSPDSLRDNRRYSRRRRGYDSDSDISMERRRSEKRSTRGRDRSLSSYSSDDRLSRRSRSFSPPRRRHRRSRRRSSVASFSSGDDRRRRIASYKASSTRGSEGRDERRHSRDIDNEYSEGKGRRFPPVPA